MKPKQPVNRGITRRGALRAGALAALGLGAGLSIAPGSAVAANRAELIDAIAANSGLSKADAKRALDAFIDTTTKALTTGDRADVVGFGSFSISKRSARTGRNPQTGKRTQSAAKNEVKFKAGAELSKAVN